MCRSVAAGGRRCTGGGTPSRARAQTAVVLSPEEGAKAVYRNSKSSPDEILAAFDDLKGIRGPSAHMARHALVNMDNAPAEVVVRGYGDLDSYRKEIHARRTTSPELLRMLAKERDWNVKASAAGNPNTPLSVVKHLASLKDRQVSVPAKAALAARTAND